MAIDVVVQLSVLMVRHLVANVALGSSAVTRSELSEAEVDGEGSPG